MADLVDRSISIPAFAMVTEAFIEAAKAQSARSVQAGLNVQARKCLRHRTRGAWR